MSDSSHAGYMTSVLVFCGAAAVMVPAFRYLGQSAVLGYLAAGIVIGPSAFAFIGQPETIRDVAELGVVLFLFIIGLELEASQLFSMRRDIFGLGLLQMSLCGTAIAGLAWLFGLPAAGAIVVGLALSLSATSVALQMLEERRDVKTPYGQRSFAILLFQDLSIIPILALIPLVASAGAIDGASLSDALFAAWKAFAAVAVVVVVGRYGLNPFFRLLAASGAREVLTAAALLVVLGSAMLLESVGLSMAMGAFLAGVMLAESHFRHQLEADIEPFRGILLGLFFITVGMSIDGAIVRQYWHVLLIAAPLALLFKIGLIAVMMRCFRSSWTEAFRSAALLAPAGEFAFVLLPLAASLSILTFDQGQIATALAAITMALGPMTAKGFDLFLARCGADVPEPDLDGIKRVDHGVIVVGFGRFGQMVNQALLSQEIDVTVIDSNIDRIRSAAKFGFKVYYGDGTRLDVLRAAGAARARLICICIDDREAALKILKMAKEDFPNALIHVRAYDRVHAIALLEHRPDFALRETFLSALAFGQATLEALGLEASHAKRIIADFRQRDEARLQIQRQDGIMGGSDLPKGRTIQPEPLIAPKAKPRPLTEETRDIIDTPSLQAAP